MDSVDLEVLRSATRWMNQGARVTLVTITRTWGSSPRPAGAMLVMRDDGRVVGSVSGGCVEEDLIQRARAHSLQGLAPEVLTYGVSAEQARQFGLPCGGTIQVVVEPLGPGSAIGELLLAIEGGALVARVLRIADGQAHLRPAQAHESLQFDGQQLINIHGPRYRLLVIGAGQLSQFLTRIAQGLDYQVTVCDPRDEFLGEWSGDGGQLVQTMPDDTVIAMRPDARMAVVALTHDPKLDDLALMEALRSDAFYVGAIGSRANHAVRRERLREFDLTESQLARLHGPIGIHIGSRTPAEIAISILAEITAVKNGVALPDGVRIDVAKSKASVPGCALE
jgi:xanthine dehydrogenase accessory factor